MYWIPTDTPFFLLFPQRKLFHRERKSIVFLSFSFLFLEKILRFIFRIDFCFLFPTINNFITVCFSLVNQLQELCIFSFFFSISHSLSHTLSYLSCTTFPCRHFVEVESMPIEGKEFLFLFLVFILPRSPLLSILSNLFSFS